MTGSLRNPEFRPTKAQKRRIIAAVKAKEAPRYEIARCYGCHPMTLSRLLKSWGFAAKTRGPYNKKEDQK